MSLFQNEEATMPIIFFTLLKGMTINVLGPICPKISEYEFEILIF